MDPELAAASQALTRADPLGALRYVALRNDPPALALRGVATAQLGDFARARQLLARAERGFRKHDPGARARCLAADGELALECREVDAAERSLTTALAVLESVGDRENVWFCRLQLVRRAVLVGELEDASRALTKLDRRGLPDRMRALVGLVAADIATRSLRPASARRALLRARTAAESSGITALVEDTESKLRELDAPVGRLFRAGAPHDVTLDEVAALSRSSDVVVDLSQREVRAKGHAISLARRPVLSNLAAALGEASPGDVERGTLIQRAFGGLVASESLRARLRVEIGRLRRAVTSLCRIEATERGFVMTARSARAVVVLHPPEAGDAGRVLALLSGGAAWSTSSLAQAIGTSARTVQRVLAELEAVDRVHSVGAGRSQKWIGADLPGFATSLLLVSRSPSR